MPRIEIVPCRAFWGFLLGSWIVLISSAGDCPGYGLPGKELLFALLLFACYNISEIWFFRQVNNG